MSVLGGIFANSSNSIAGPIDDRDNRDKDATFECDYDSNPIPLYQAMESEAWVPTLEFFETGQWSGSVFSSIFGVSDPLPPERQARTWVTRYEPDGRTVRWSQLPLHAALAFKAPYRIIERLLTLYPASVRCTNDEHMLPLHLAMKYGAPDNVVRLLCHYFPEAARQRDRKGRVPMDHIGSTLDRDVILKTFLAQTKRNLQKLHDKEVREVKQQHQKTSLKLKESEQRNLTLQEELSKAREEAAAAAKELEDVRTELQKTSRQQVSNKGDVRTLVQTSTRPTASPKRTSSRTQPLPSSSSTASGKPPRPKPSTKGMFKFTTE